MIIAIAVILALVLILLLVLVGYGVRILKEYQRVVVFRLGRAVGVRGPGLIIINPIIDRVQLVDLRELFLEIPHQIAITKDNASISIDFIIFYQVVDPAASVIRVQNFAAAAQNVAATTLRSVVGDMPLDDVLSKREEMNMSLRTRLDEITERWGVKVTTVEVREVNPPGVVLEAMTRQMSAERSRRAAITEAQGQKQAAITLAEGRQQAAILEAEGQRQAAVLRAEGLARSLSAIQQTGRGLDPNTMRLQYLETLKTVGTSQATKIVVPLEFAGILDGLKGIRPDGSSPAEASDLLPDVIGSTNVDGSNGGVGNGGVGNGAGGAGANGEVVDPDPAELAAWPKPIAGDEGG